VIALQPVVCCELRLSTLIEESTRVRELGVALVQLLSRATEPRLDLAHGSVRQRVTAFLLDLSQRLERRGFDCRRFTIGLSRQELADLLDTRIETVSRMMQRLNREGAIRVVGSSVGLLTLARESRS
jgi:CRP/FNR family transcriptional regulator